MPPWSVIWWRINKVLFDRIEYIKFLKLSFKFEGLVVLLLNESKQFRWWHHKFVTNWQNVDIKVTNDGTLAHIQHSRRLRYMVQNHVVQQTRMDSFYFRFCAKMGHFLFPPGYLLINNNSSSVLGVSQSILWTPAAFFTHFQSNNCPIVFF